MDALFNPRQVALVTSRAKTTIFGKEQVKDNIAATTWHTPMSRKPLMYGVTLPKESFSSHLIMESKCFVVNFMDTPYKNKLLYCARKSGKLIDKFKEVNLTREEASKVDCPRIEEAHGHLECEVIGEVETGDHILFVGRILHSVKKFTGRKLFHVKEDEFTTTR